MDRKQFLGRMWKASAAAALAGPLTRELMAGAPGAPHEFRFAQEPLPYAFDALEPHIDARTMEIHFTKHHAAYVKNVNEAIVAEGVHAHDERGFFGAMSTLSAKVRNNGGGAWNHSFFWRVMGPGKGGAPIGKVGDAIDASFGSFGKFQEVFAEAAMKRFGSGWAWLVEQDGQLAVGSTANQDNPMMDLSELKGRPLLGLDVWEHAYYLKYQNKRNDYVAAWWNVVNWEEVARRMPG